MTEVFDPAPLFRPLTLPTFELPNRIVMSAMTREFAPGGILDTAAAEYYARRVEGGAALVITEGTSIGHPVSHHTAKVPHFYGADALAAWKGVVERVHAAGGRIFPQLWHTGLYRLRDETANPDDMNIAPSQVGRFPSRPMTENDIADVIAAFAEAARAAREIGFDGVAIHGAHGYLIDQFLWPRTNRRTDAYGGSAENRVRFGVEVVKAVRAAIGPNFPLLLRISQWKGNLYGQELAKTPAELEELLVPFAEAGVDIFDASMRRFWLPEFDGSPMNLAGWAKKLTGKLTMAVGSVGLEGPLDGIRVSEQSATAVSIDNLRALVEMMDRGDFDLVGVGRNLLANPDWPQIVARGEFERLRPYDPARTAALLEPSLGN
ncbi:MAG: 12-oxophytodienoate reductase [Frankiales bacterium]|nr:12-oxophytodienoate reductase [Frankiales bacterium]